MNRFLRACRKEEVDRPPVWVMRQAGRYLPEYREVRKKAGDFLTMCHTPEIAAEVTLQPIRRFGLDAAIVFSDILTPLVPMGAELTFNPAPQIANPIRKPTDLDGFAGPDPWTGTDFLSQTLERVREELDDDTALIGFCGAPWTLASYLVEGSDLQVLHPGEVFCPPLPGGFRPPRQHPRRCDGGLPPHPGRHTVRRRSRSSTPGSVPLPPKTLGGGPSHRPDGSSRPPRISGSRASISPTEAATSSRTSPICPARFWDWTGGST